MTVVCQCFSLASFIIFLEWAPKVVYRNSILSISLQLSRKADAGNRSLQGGQLKVSPSTCVCKCFKWSTIFFRFAFARVQLPPQRLLSESDHTQSNLTILLLFYSISENGQMVHPERSHFHITQWLVVRFVVVGMVAMAKMKANLTA